MSNVVRFDCFEVDFGSRQLQKRGVKLKLRGQSFQILASLLEHPGQVVTREELRRYNLYLQGRYRMYTDIANAKHFLAEAVARDPQFARAYDALGEHYWWAGFVGLVPPKQAFSAGLWAALRAIEIDNTLAGRSRRALAEITPTTTDRHTTNSGFGRQKSSGSPPCCFQRVVFLH